MTQAVASGAEPQARCSKCNRAIIWHTNENGKHEPFDARPTRVLVTSKDKSPRGVEYDLRGKSQVTETAHVSHFVTCPFADSFRRPRTPGGGS